MINSLKLGIAAGIVGAILTFFTTISGIYGRSNAHKILESTVWGSFGYKASWKGAFIGLILGFIYAFVLVLVFALFYNLLKF